MITIKEVLSKKDFKKFVSFPNQLYKDNPYFVPSLMVDQLEKLNPKANPAYRFCETKCFLAYKDKKIVGRICGLINYAYIEKVDKPTMRFTRFDVIDDLEVSRKLFDAVIEWGQSKKMSSIMGPMGFTDTDEQGMLVEGFEEMNLSITLYNHEYYPRHLEALGFKKDADWVEYQISMPKEIDQRVERISEMVQKRYGYSRKQFGSTKELIPYARQAFDVINASFAKLYGTVPLTDEIVEKYIKDYITKVHLDFVIVVVNKEDEVIGFGLLVPSLAQAYKNSKGKLLPFGVFRLLRALKKITILEMYFIAVKPEYQNMGVNAIIISESVKEGVKHQVQFAETGPELEMNNQVQDQWKTFDARQHRRRRSYILDFSKKDFDNN